MIKDCSVLRKREQRVLTRDCTGESGSSASLPMADADAPRRPLIAALRLIADIMQNGEVPVGTVELLVWLGGRYW